MSAIKNRTRGTILHERPRWALTLWQQMRGLMFSTPRAEALIMLFLPPRRDGVHMFFVFAPLDLLVLDGQGKVIALKEQLRPWQTWHPGMHMHALLELPAGTIARTKTGLGDYLTLPQPPVTIHRWIRQS